jgi:hypothetical protein
MSGAKKNFNNSDEKAPEIFQALWKKYYVQYVQFTIGCGLQYYLKASQHVFTEKPFCRQWYQPTVEELTRDIWVIYYFKKS